MQIAINMPLRMQLGKLGISLVRFGRMLQVRYANWNREFRLKAEMCPNPNRCVFHVSEEVTTQMILTFESRDCQKEKSSSLIDDLFNIQGITSVTLMPYQVTIGKGTVFSWDELRPDIEAVLLRHLTK